MYKRKNILRCFLLLWLIMLASCGISKSVNHQPKLEGYNNTVEKRITINDSTFTSAKNSLAKNKNEQWELYVEGDPLQIGLHTGNLTKELYKKQELALFSKVKQMVPSKGWQNILRKLLAWYNRKIYLHVPEEYKTEIYGLSQYADNKYDFFAEPYLRALYLHGAHDIGHALQDLALVGCSSFAAWGDKTEDGNLIIGRNFDFYAGDDFAEEKIIAFINPTQGHKFMSVTWGGMMGVVSGMNEHGLTVTINAGKSKVPLVAKTPISIVTREILQYAATIDEAITIAKKREVFVSESIFVGSANDNKAVTIEVSPKNFGVYKVENTNRLICTNHFQSSAYKADRHNKKHIEESHSKYRYERLEELIDTKEKLNPERAVAILRNKDGVAGETIGYGNEKALNQLLAHHGIVFQPSKRLVWVSSNPYQLGEFTAYDLNKVFNDTKKGTSFSSPSLNIEKDPFQYTEAYTDYEENRVLKRKVQAAISDKKHLEPSVLTKLRQTNPFLWETHYLTGLYSYNKGYYRAALNAFKAAKKLEITTVPDEKEVDLYIKKLKRKLNE